MSEIILTIILMTFMVYHAWYVWENNKQSKRLMKGIMSKNIHEFTQSEVAEEAVKQQPKGEEFSPLSDLSDKQFDKLIKKQVKD